MAQMVFAGRMYRSFTPPWYLSLESTLAGNLAKCSRDISLRMAIKVIDDIRISTYGLAPLPLKIFASVPVMTVF